ncbi:MAG TPA: hypothetical protein VNH22_12805 [Blastocatellia bacterium]|nr:hypothetical protein [Blastocatellia bacterium]
MLNTLNRYIEDRPDGGPPLSGAGLGRDRRFYKILGFSTLGHLAFYALLINVDILSIHRQVEPERGRGELVRLIEIAPPRNLSPLRSAPEPADRADINRMEFDPDSDDDLHLIPRSPRPAQERGASPLLAPPETGRQIRAARESAGRADTGHLRDNAQPPVTAQVLPGRMPAPNAPAAIPAPFGQNAPAPPTPPQSRGPVTSPTPSNDAAQAGARRGEGAEPRALGLQSIQTQYNAFIRSKISKENERIMPRGWIEETLNDKVSADFRVVLRRGGVVVSRDLLRSTGYRKLDELARQAIYMASPFEGWPQNAGETITLTVTVYYTPTR